MLTDSRSEHTIDELLRIAHGTAPAPAPTFAPGNTLLYQRMLEESHQQLADRLAAWDESVIELDRASGAYARAYSINEFRTASPNLRPTTSEALRLTTHMAVLILIATCLVALSVLG